MCWFDEKATHKSLGNSRPFFHWAGGTPAPNIPGKPTAKRDAIGKPHDHPFKVSVTASHRIAAPRAGRATDHRVRFLAEEFSAATGDIEVVLGRMNVNKNCTFSHPNGCGRALPGRNGPDSRFFQARLARAYPFSTS